MQAPSAEDFFGGKSVKSASFDGPPPIAWTGPITELPPLQQKRDFDSGEPQYWSDGRPKWVMPVYIQTDQRTDQDDDGVRALYLEYKTLHAVRDAVKKAGAERLVIGGILTLTYVPPKPKAGGSKLYTAKYAPPPPGSETQPEDPWAVTAPPIGSASPAPVTGASLDPDLV